MGIGVLVLQDGTPCVVHDEPLPNIASIEYDKNVHMITLVWTDEKTKKVQKRKLEHALDPRIGAVLERVQIAAIGHLTHDGKKDRIETIKFIPVDII